MLIESLRDRQAFRLRRSEAWNENITYWLSQPLRHVDDVGGYIVQRALQLCAQSRSALPILLDVGFGSGWLASALGNQGVTLKYIGLDQNEKFVDRGKSMFHGMPNIVFRVVDMDEEVPSLTQADVVVNAFNFFELCDLPRAMRNISNNLRAGGTLIASTIDKTYLLIALSENSTELSENFRRYQELPGIKFGFQRIDTGTKLSEILEYPSVLYSTEDFIEAAAREGLKLTSYRESVFTAKPIPKIYIHLEFVKQTLGHTQHNGEPFSTSNS